VKLRMLNPGISDDGYWLEGAGSIQQIVFATDTEGNKSWLAVRKGTSTTILRPIYRQSPVPARVPAGFQTMYGPSCLDSNPAVTIANDMTNGRSHVDVSFNPWYPRQLAIIDEMGYWRVWDIEGRNRGQKRTVLGKSGYIYDDQAAYDATPDAKDSGWGKILWAGNVSTIIVCNKRHLAIFDLKSQPVRLQSPDLVAADTCGRILDVKRSPIQLDKVFVLTTSRLFLLRINAAGEHHDDDRLLGASIIMSCPHYRETHGTSLKFELQGQGDTCNIFLYSTNMFLVNVYKFVSTPEAATPFTWSTDAFFLRREFEENQSSDIAGICIRRAPLKSGEGRVMSGLGGKYLEHGNSFYQLFSLGQSLDLSQTVLAESHQLPASSPGQAPRYENIVIPNDSRITPSDRRIVSAPTINDFVVPDGLEDGDDFTAPLPTGLSPLRDKSVSRDQRPQMIDARRIYELATSDKAWKPQDKEDYPDVELTMSDYIQNIVGGIQHRKQLDQEGLSTFHDLAGFEKFSEDIDDGAALLRDFVESFKAIEEDSPMAVTLRSAGLFDTLGLDSSFDRTSNLPDLSKAYDILIDIWVSSLPQRTPGLVRIAKERLIRTIAADLCMSSLLVSIRSNSVPSTDPSPSSPEPQRLTLPLRGLPPPSPLTPLRPLFSSHDYGFDPASSFPTPAPSEGSVLAEPRAYALGVRSQKPLGPAREAILDQWPAAPGSDPASYVWRPGQAGAVEEEEESDEEAARRRMREEKRRRRTERFLKRRETALGVPSSQPLLGVGEAGGSQPEYRQTQMQTQMLASSSQVHVPMTQPSAGTYGSRSGLGGGKKKKKKRKMGF